MNGLVTIPSSNEPNITCKRAEAAIKAKDMTLFARVDHAAGASEIGMTLRPTVVLIFGAAQAGTPLMQAKQTVGIDLPLKVLVWQDASEKTWLSYIDPAWIARRHNLGPEAEPIVGKMGEVLAAVAQEAAAT